MNETIIHSLTFRSKDDNFLKKNVLQQTSLSNFIYPLKKIKYLLGRGTKWWCWRLAQDSYCLQGKIQGTKLGTHGLWDLVLTCPSSHSFCRLPPSPPWPQSGHEELPSVTSSTWHCVPNVGTTLLSTSLIPLPFLSPSTSSRQHFIMYQAHWDKTFSLHSSSCLQTSSPWMRCLQSSQLPH